MRNFVFIVVMVVVGNILVRFEIDPFYYFLGGWMTASLFNALADGFAKGAEKSKNQV